MAENKDISDTDIRRKLNDTELESIVQDKIQDLRIWKNKNLIHLPGRNEEPYISNGPYSRISEQSQKRFFCILAYLRDGQRIESIKLIKGEVEKEYNLQIVATASELDQNASGGRVLWEIFLRPEDTIENSVLNSSNVLINLAFNEQKDTKVIDEEVPKKASTFPFLKVFKGFFILGALMLFLSTLLQSSILDGIQAFTPNLIKSFINYGLLALTPYTIGRIILKLFLGTEGSRGPNRGTRVIPPPS